MLCPKISVDILAGLKKLFSRFQVAQTGDALVDIELSGSGGDGISSTSSSEPEVQDTDAINVGGSASEETDAESAKRSAVKVLATPAVRYSTITLLMFRDVSGYKRLFKKIIIEN